MKKIQKVTPKRLSKIYPIKLKDLIIEKIEWILKNEVLDEPYIAWISIEQMIWGKGMHWNEENCPEYIQKGIIKHMGIRKASHLERARWKRVTGWEAPELPPSMYISIKQIIKEKIINKIILEEKYSGIKPFWANGYIDPSTDPPSFNAAYHKDIVGYFFYLDDIDTYKFSESWLDSLTGKNRAIRLQWEYNKEAFKRMIRTQIASASAKLDILEATEKFNSYELINPVLKPNEITWQKEGD